MEKYVVKRLIKKFNEKEKLIKCLIKGLLKKGYTIEEVESLIDNFYKK